MRTLIITLSLGACLAASQETVPLRLGLGKDTALKARLVIEHDSVTVPRGTTERHGNRFQLELGLETRGVSAEKLNVIRVTILRMCLDAGENKFDTTNPNPKDPPQAAYMKALIGEWVDYDVASDGNIKEVRGLDDLEKRVLQKLHIEPGTDGPHTGLKARIGVELRDALGQLLAVYPEKAIGAGSEWNRKLSVPSEMGAYHSDCRWTYSGRRDGRNHLSGKWMLTEFPDADKKGRELTLVQKLKGSGEGTLELDGESGFPVGGTMTHHLSGTTFFDGLKAHFESDTFDVTSTIRFKVEKWDGK